ncbi:STAS domain-containing protein [Amycolatopsis sp. NPDC004378]
MPQPTDLLEIRSHTSETGVLTIQVRGDLDGSTRHLLRTKFTAALDVRPPAIVADLAEIGFCDSTGVEVLVRLHQCGLELGIPVHIAPAPGLRRVLDLAGLTDVLDLR